MNDSNIPTIDVQGVPSPLTDGHALLDVREPHEWAAGHIDGAVHIPLGDLPTRLGELDPTTPTLVICHLGGRSARATQWLQAQGYDATNVEGGMEAWEAAGLPVVS
ncbi:rhodanese-like domain-containing protein [Aeromicrobium sp. P5_D10]